MCFRFACKKYGMFYENSDKHGQLYYTSRNSYKTFSLKCRYNLFQGLSYIRIVRKKTKK